MKSTDKNSNINRFGGFLIFFSVAALSWIVMKLSNDYTITLKFNAKFSDAPASRIVPQKDYPIDATVTASGFKLLKYYFKPTNSRNINVTLKDAKYKILSDNRYSVGNTLIKESIADFLEINIYNIELPQADYIFTMNKLASKRVKVNLQTDISFKSQYNIYGEPSVSPDSITIFGSYDDIKDLQFVNTQTIAMRNVVDDINESVDLKFEDETYAEIKKVDVNIRVEKFTEAEMTIPINTLGVNNLVIFPDKAKIKYIVALDDYPNISTLSFNIEIDTTNFKTLEFLPLKPAVYPNNTSIIGIYPDKVEYLMTK
ncbi:MAG: hypothetical protein Q4F69_09645 [Bacteroidia bacterium]|nr:hypothetical protein [Bacteroidia bacterium]